jgi:hypothetical protein
MKQLIVIIATLISSTTFAQSDSSKVEQYCQVIASPRLLSNRVTIDIDFGEEKSYWRDSRLKSIDGILKKFNTVIDALNYMGKEGWKFINAYPVNNGSTTIYHFAFKKEFAIADVR